MVSMTQVCSRLLAVQVGHQEGLQGHKRGGYEGLRKCESGMVNKGGLV